MVGGLIEALESARIEELMQALSERNNFSSPDVIFVNAAVCFRSFREHATFTSLQAISTPTLLPNIKHDPEKQRDSERDIVCPLAAMSATLILKQLESLLLGKSDQAAIATGHLYRWPRRLPQSSRRATDH